ncbi:MAG TPA: hypothetical protein VK560_06330 [Gemmatimonadaceae bacterium]|nr:hypothetical protein [Gemmatimonadaceae bacterium]
MSVRSGLKKLGDRRGRTESDFVAALGSPSAVKTLTSGRRLFEWHSGRVQRQMIAVLFDRDQILLKVVALHPEYLVSTEADARGNETRAFDEGQRAGLDLRDEISTSARSRRRASVWARSAR